MTQDDRIAIINEQVDEHLHEIGVTPTPQSRFWACKGLMEAMTRQGGSGSERSLFLIALAHVCVDHQKNLRSLV